VRFPDSSNLLDHPNSRYLRMGELGLDMVTAPSDVHRRGRNVVTDLPVPVVPVSGIPHRGECLIDGPRRTDALSERTVSHQFQRHGGAPVVRPFLMLSQTRNSGVVRIRTRRLNSPNLFVYEVERVTRGLFGNGAGCQKAIASGGNSPVGIMLRSGSETHGARDTVRVELGFRGCTKGVVRTV